MLGIYDSGLGGLTALRAARELMPSADIIYFADTAHLPYGTRSPEKILSYAENAIDFFAKKQVKALLCACGTVSCVALPRLTSAPPFKILGVAESAVKAAIAKSPCLKIGVIATSATAASGHFQRLIQKHSPNAHPLCIPCDFFVSIAENGFAENEAIANEAARVLLAPLSGKIDTLILGCTHFPLLKSAIKKALPNVILIDSAREGALALSSLAEKGNGKTELYASDLGAGFIKTARTILGENAEFILDNYNVKEI